jgi:glutathione S-transferase
MELLAAEDGHILQEVCLSAKLAGVALPVVHVHRDALALLHPLSMSLLLKCPHGYIAEHHTILRFFAELAPGANLYGRSEFEQAQARASVYVLVCRVLWKRMCMHCVVFHMFVIGRRSICGLISAG